MMHRCIVLSLCFLRIPVQGIVRSWSKIHDTYLSCMELWDTSCWAWIIYRLYRMAHSHNQMHRTGKKYAFCRRDAVFCTSDQSNEKTLQSGDQVYSSYNADHIFFLYHRVLKTFYVFCKSHTSPQLNSTPNQLTSRFLFRTWEHCAREHQGFFVISGTFHSKVGWVKIMILCPIDKSGKTFEKSLGCKLRMVERESMLFIVDITAIH